MEGGRQHQSSSEILEKWQGTKELIHILRVAGPTVSYIGH